MQWGVSLRKLIKRHGKGLYQENGNTTIYWGKRTLLNGLQLDLTTTIFSRFLPLLFCRFKSIESSSYGKNALHNFETFKLHLQKELGSPIEKFQSDDSDKMLLWKIKDVSICLHLLYQHDYRLIFSISNN